MIRVDGQTYQWMGDPAGSLNGVADVSTVDQRSFEYTSTKSIFIMDVGGKVQMNITFLSPVTPNDYKRQSLPMSYMDVSVVSTDGQEHSVQMYSDISAGMLEAWKWNISGPFTDKQQNGLLEMYLLLLSGRPKIQAILPTTKSGGRPS